MSSESKIVLISGFDPFLGGTSNNSSLIGEILEQRFKSREIEVIFCPIKTVFFKASEQLMAFIDNLNTKPDFVISLGEASSRDIRFETRSINWMFTEGGDNDGVNYPNGSIIDADVEKYLPMTIDLESLRKKIHRKEKKYISISNDAGTYVCNNTSFLMTRDLKIPYAFIHVPSHSLPKQKQLINRTVLILEKTIQLLFT